MNEVFLCLGGNMGNRLALLEEALQYINQTIGSITAASQVYETAAWGHSSEHTYYNMVVRVATKLSAQLVLENGLKIEADMGRKRTAIGYSDRSMDIDLLFYNNEIIETPQLSIPHPRLHLRQFVLVPLVEIAPNFMYPGTNKTMLSLLQTCTDTEKPQIVAKLD